MDDLEAATQETQRSKELAVTEEVLIGRNQEIDRSTLSEEPVKKAFLTNFVELYNQENKEVKLQNKTEKENEDWEK